MEQLKPQNIDPKKPISIYDTGRFIKSNINKILIVVVYLIAILIRFVSVDIESFVQLREITINVVMLAMCSFVVYNARFETGKQDGRKNKDYIAISKEFKELKSEYMDLDKMEELKDFCKRYNEDELKATRTNILHASGIKYEDYISHYADQEKKNLLLTVDANGHKERLGIFVNGKYVILTKRQVKSILLCNKLKMLNLTAEKIVGVTKASRRRGLPIAESADNDARKRKITKMVLLFVNVLLVGSVTAKIAANPTFATFVWALFNLLPIVTSDVFGYNDGVYNIAGVETDNLTSKCDILKQCKKN